MRSIIGRRRLRTVQLILFRFGLRSLSLQIPCVGCEFPVFSDNSVIIHQQAFRPCNVVSGPSSTELWSHPDTATDNIVTMVSTIYLQILNEHPNVTSRQEESDMATNASLLPSHLYSKTASLIHSFSVHSYLLAGAPLGQEKELIAR
jgi:hypothetical protein